MSTVKLPPTTFFPLKIKFPSLIVTVPSCCPATFLPTQVMVLLVASTFLVCALIVPKATNNANAIVFKFFILKLI